MENAADEQLIFLNDRALLRRQELEQIRVVDVAALDELERMLLDIILGAWIFLSSPMGARGSSSLFCDGRTARDAGARHGGRMRAGAASRAPSTDVACA